MFQLQWKVAEDPAMPWRWHSRVNALDEGQAQIAAYALAAHRRKTPIFFAYRVVANDSPEALKPTPVHPDTAWACEKFKVQPKF